MRPGVQGGPKTYELGQLERKERENGFKIHKEIFETGNIFQTISSKQSQPSNEDEKP